MDTKQEKKNDSAFDNFAENTFVMVEPGDIIIQLNNIPFPRDSKCFPKSTEGLPSFLGKLCRPAHLALAKGAIQEEDSRKTLVYNAKVIHSFFAGVETTATDELIDPNATLGTVLALRCLDTTIKANIQKLIMVAEKQQIPFALAGTRGLLQAKLSAEDVARLELFRAFRVYARLSPEDTGQPEPMSKKQGVSCSNFVSYIFKAAIIAKFFPNGLNKDLMECYKLIETQRKQGDKHLEQNKLQPLLKEFEAKALAYLKENQAQAVHIQELKRPVKNANIKDFTYSALKSPLWCAGIYCINQNKHEEVIIPHQLYAMLQGAENPSKTAKISLSI